jgi:hypothetical protein
MKRLATLRCKSSHFGAQIYKVKIDSCVLESSVSS